MGKVEFIKNLLGVLQTAPLKSTYKKESDLEKDIFYHVKKCVKGFLQCTDKELNDIIFTHGETPEEKKWWTASKNLQNVVVYGCSNTSDIFIQHKRLGRIYFEIKLAKKRGKGASTLPGSLQRSVGQSVIASLKHPCVICFIACETGLDRKVNDRGDELCGKLRKDHNIELIVRELR